MATITPNTTASGAADFPEFPAHPEPQIMRWSALEIVAIRKYGADMFRAGRLEASAPSPQPAAPQWDWDMLRAHAEGRVTHINNGLCPDIIEGHDTRDPECPVCQALLENHTALPAPPQGATKEQK